MLCLKKSAALTFSLRGARAHQFKGARATAEALAGAAAASASRPAGCVRATGGVCCPLTRGGLPAPGPFSASSWPAPPWACNGDAQARGAGVGPQLRQLQAPRRAGQHSLDLLGVEQALDLCELARLLCLAHGGRGRTAARGARRCCSARAQGFAAPWLVRRWVSAEVALSWCGSSPARGRARWLRAAGLREQR